LFLAAEIGATGSTAPDSFRREMWDMKTIKGILSTLITVLLLLFAGNFIVNDGGGIEIASPETPAFTEQQPGHVVAPAPEVGGTAGEAARAGDETWGNKSTLRDHFERHGADFGAQNPQEYAEKAHALYVNRGNYQVKIDAEGTIRIYDPVTNAFGSYNADGTTKTFFKPSAGQSYFNRQPGQ
jgi:hypothetical protein